MNRKQLEQLFSDNQQLVNLLSDLWDVIQAWDDAYDGDPADHDDGYKKAMINLPSNPLYFQAQIPLLFPRVYYDWRAANYFEENKEQLHKAYMLRASWYGLIIMVIHVLYGPEKAEEFSPAIWSAYGETYEEYEKELLNA